MQILTKINYQCVIHNSKTRYLLHYIGAVWAKTHNVDVSAYKCSTLWITSGINRNWMNNFFAYTLPLIIHLSIRLQQMAVLLTHPYVYHIIINHCIFTVRSNGKIKALVEKTTVNLYSWLKKSISTESEIISMSSICGKTQRFHLSDWQSVHVSSSILCSKGKMIEWKPRVGLNVV